MAESDKREDKEDNGKKASKLAGVPVSDIKAHLKELRANKKSDEWLGISTTEFRKILEKKFKLDGKLKNYEDEIEVILDEIDDEAKKSKKKDPKKEDNKKKHRTNSPEKPSKKSKRHSYDSDSESRDRKKKSKRSPKKSTKDIDLEDPVVRRIDRLKKTIRGCGVPLTGFTKDLDNETSLKKLRQIIADNEKVGMKEKMGRSEMIKVRKTVTANREIEELERIPKKLKVSGKHPRKARSKNVHYDGLPKTGVDFLDKESSGSESEKEESSNYSSS